MSTACLGLGDSGIPTYVALLEEVKSDLAALGGGGILLDNRLQLYLALDHMVFLNLLDVPGLVPAAAAPMDPVRLAS